ncbi:MAG: hypothetical protein IKA25_03995 [Alphaproteobacteria bacterium]|nr:hypothetical protein [Alphaproteobacteria bacterium]
MKKHLIFMPLLVCMLPYAANAAIAETDLDLQYRKCKFSSPGELLVGTTYTYDRTCYDTGDFGSACYNCISGSMVSNGVEVVENKGVEAKILGTSIICSCNTRSSTAACAAGYYGTGTYSILGGGTGCTACPENATCAGGNGTTFLCNVGYFANGDVCERCPSSGGVYGTTAAIGATARSECYIPAGDISFTDDTGTYVCGEDSYFSE